MMNKFVAAFGILAAVALVAMAPGASAQECSGIPKLFYWNLINTPPAPNVTVEYDETTKLFNFDVSATYLLENSAYVIDFAPFDPSDATRQIDQPNNCENRLATDFSGVAFSDMWSAAADAEEPSALGTSSYLAYPPAGDWDIASDGCAGVDYHREMGFGSLAGCQDHNAASAVTRSLVPETNPPQYVYGGALYATVVQPINPNAQAAGYRAYEFSTPFQWTVTMETNAIAAIESEQDLIVQVVSVSVLPDNSLQVILQTTAINDATGLKDPYVQLTPDGLPVSFESEIGSPANSQTQQWIFTSDVVLDEYEGTFEIGWTLASTDGTTAEDVLSIITIDMVVNDLVQADIAIDNLLTVYTDEYITEYEYQVTEPFGSGDDVWVKSHPDVNEEDYNSFTNKVVNAWVCFTNSGSAPEWDPQNGKFGCSVDTADIPFDNRVQLIALEDAQTSGRDGLLEAFQTVIDPPSVFTYTSEAGFHFRAVAIAFADQDFYIHVESETLPVDPTPGARSLTTHSIFMRSDANPADTPLALSSEVIDADVGAFEMTYIPEEETLTNPGGNTNDDGDDGDDGGDGGKDGGVPWTWVLVLVPTNMCCFIVAGVLWRRKKDEEEQEEPRKEQEWEREVRRSFDGMRNVSDAVPNDAAVVNMA